METIIFCKRMGNDRNGNARNEIKVYHKQENTLELNNAGTKTKDIFPYGRYYSKTNKVVTTWEPWEIKMYCKENNYFYIMED